MSLNINSDNITREFYISMLTVILMIISIIIFLLSGGSILFYIFIAITIIVGIWNSLTIEKKGEKEGIVKHKNEPRQEPAVKSTKSNSNRKNSKTIK